MFFINSSCVPNSINFPSFKTKNLLDGSKKIIDELSAKLIQQVRIIQELEYDKATYKKEIEKLLAEKNK